MGLDMYLTGRRFLWSMKDHPDAEVEANIRKAIPDFCGSSVTYVETEAAYWRKANAIHRWFVDNVQGGKDDCGYYDVSREQLKKLVETCQQVLDNPDLAGTLLPTSSGFFFGGQHYDEYYMDRLQYTIEKLTEIQDEKYENWDFQYHSSW